MVHDTNAMLVPDLFEVFRVDEDVTVAATPVAGHCGHVFKATDESLDGRGGSGPEGYQKYNFGTYILKFDFAHFG